MICGHQHPSFGGAWLSGPLVDSPPATRARTEAVIKKRLQVETRLQPVDPGRFSLEIEVVGLGPGASSIPTGPSFDSRSFIPFVGTSTRILLAKRFTGVRRLPGRFLPRIARSSSLLAPLTVDSFGFWVTRDRDGMPLMTATQPDLDRFRLPFITLSPPSPLPGWLWDEAHASFRVASTRRRSFLFRPLAGFVRTARLFACAEDRRTTLPSPFSLNNSPGVRDGSVDRVQVSRGLVVDSLVAT